MAKLHLSAKQVKLADSLKAVARLHLPSDQLDDGRSLEVNDRGAVYVMFSVGGKSQRMYYFANEKSGNPKIVLSTVDAEGKVLSSQEFSAGTSYTDAHMAIWFAEQHEQEISFGYSGSPTPDADLVPVESNIPDVPSPVAATASPAVTPTKMSVA